ncbi:MAG: MBL fold metallo-hydrolase [Candidatus Enteromonas sp.]|nr:MBL fold metallo-hydrolase [Candidatus Enteromonas sp.]
MTRIVRLSGNDPWSNVYVLGNEGEPCIFIDFGVEDGGSLLRYAEKHHSMIAGIFLTHGHFDHINGLRIFEKGAPCPVFLSTEDERCLFDSEFNLSVDFGLPPLKLPFIRPYLVEDEDEVKLGNTILKVHATPFHTSGSVCYETEDGILFSGDSVFRFGIGRYDLRGAEPRSKQASIDKILSLQEISKVYPGHGPSTTLQEIRQWLPSID